MTSPAASAATHPAVARLQALVRIPTVSHRDQSLVDTEAFDAFVVELERQYPLLHERLELTRVDTHGLLFRWAGAGSAGARPPRGRRSDRSC